MLATAGLVMARELPSRSLNRMEAASPAVQVSNPTPPATPAADPIELGAGLQGDATTSGLPAGAAHATNRQVNSAIAISKRMIFP